MLIKGLKGAINKSCITTLIPPPLPNNSLHSASIFFINFIIRINRRNIITVQFALQSPFKESTFNQSTNKSPPIKTPPLSPPQLSHSALSLCPPPPPPPAALSPLFRSFATSTPTPYMTTHRTYPRWYTDL